MDETKRLEKEVARMRMALEAIVVLANKGATNSTIGEVAKTGLNGVKNAV